MHVYKNHTRTHITPVSSGSAIPGPNGYKNILRPPGIRFYQDGSSLGRASGGGFLERASDGDPVG
jgi:hypothetical protein